MGDNAQKDKQKRMNGHRPEGGFAPGNPWAIKPGQVLNPGGRPKGSRSYASRSIMVDRTPVVDVKWALKLWRKLFGKHPNEMPPDGYQIGDLMVHADKLNRARGKVGYLIEDNARREGKVADKLEVQQAAPVVVALFPSSPPAGWYGKVRDLIGVEPGDPQLPSDAPNMEIPDNGKGDTTSH